MESRYDAIVIGLGPVGSFMALKLEQQGMKVLAIDKEKDIYPLPRAVSMSDQGMSCLLYTSPSPRDLSTSRMPSSA